MLPDCELYQYINTRLVPLHSIHQQLGVEKSTALVAFHAITGSDCTSYLICRKSKRTLWKSACQDKQVIRGMTSCATDAVPITHIPRWLVSFILRAYRCGVAEADEMDLTERRVALVKKLIKCRKDADIDRLLPSRALLPHLQRSQYQSLLWRQCCTISSIFLPDPCLFGWYRHDGCLCPVKVAEEIISSVVEDNDSLSVCSDLIDDDESDSEFESTESASTILYIGHHCGLYTFMYLA